MIITAVLLSIGTASAQSKSHKIAKGTNWELKAKVTESDTTYLMLFRNCKYQYITEYEAFYMDKDELTEFYEAFDKLFAGDFDDYTVSTGVNFYNSGSMKYMYYKKAYMWITPVIKKKMIKGQIKTGF